MSQFKTLFETANQEASPVVASFGTDGVTIPTTLTVTGSDGNGISISAVNSGEFNKPPDEFFIVSATDPNVAADKAIANGFVQPDTFDDPRKIIPTQGRDDLNFYIEMVDEKLNPVNISIAGGEFNLRALRLGVNPRVLTVNSAKIVSRYQTLTRWVEEHWGDELDNISLQGTTLSFILFPQDVPGSQGGGLNVSTRQLTSPYQELQQIIRIYQVNGLVYQDEKGDDGKNVVVEVEGFDGIVETFNNHPRLGMVKERFYIKLSYDYGIFIGYFESFDVIEEATAPYRLSYNINFKAEKVIWK